MLRLNADRMSQYPWKRDPSLNYYDSYLVDRLAYLCVGEMVDKMGKGRDHSFSSFPVASFACRKWPSRGNRVDHPWLANATPAREGDHLVL